MKRLVAERQQQSNTTPGKEKINSSWRNFIGMNWKNFYTKKKTRERIFKEKVEKLLKTMNF